MPRIPSAPILVKHPPKNSGEIESGGDTSPWKMGKIWVDYKDDDRTFKQCWMFGKIAIHTDTSGNNLWSISSLTTGRKIVSCETEDNARLIGEWLWSNLCTTFSQDTSEDMLAKAPKWFKDWAEYFHGRICAVTPEKWMKNTTKR